ncbi:hypothetical protein CKAH01_10611 [Colletotrichum kahawae]|uniref:Uncharacterized protein n=1 Tax=Colletotrichum kahawae TaxID=34407 RepID=A0AAD9XX64_COLKA|nr:hypothetical protein CKAH01_10611 [Colletotrichum kahawae]
MTQPTRQPKHPHKYPVNRVRLTLGVWCSAALKAPARPEVQGQPGTGPGTETGTGIAGEIAGARSSLLVPPADTHTGESKSNLRLDQRKAQASPPLLQPAQNITYPSAKAAHPGLPQFPAATQLCRAPLRDAVTPAKGVEAQGVFVDRPKAAFGAIQRRGVAFLAGREAGVEDMSQKRTHCRTNSSHTTPSLLPSITVIAHEISVCHYPEVVALHNGISAPSRFAISHDQESRSLFDSAPSPSPSSPSLPPSCSSEFPNIAPPNPRLHLIAAQRTRGTIHPDSRKATRRVSSCVFQESHHVSILNTHRPRERLALPTDFSPKSKLQRPSFVQKPEGPRHGRPPRPPPPSPDSVPGIWLTQPALPPRRLLRNLAGTVGAARDVTEAKPARPLPAVPAEGTYAVSTLQLLVLIRCHKHRRHLDAEDIVRRGTAASAGGAGASARKITHPEAPSAANLSTSL